ncbi:TetR/AcrR family transcriptional regulator [Companilactobacillus alimentarius]|uniref:TetR/AcrR family transcriptional regulator n=1 Tax=Companilactobacillus alimentarius TaxID=1602 RepID=UPI0028B9BE98|nr:TetR/AcrR family transcriptional regulator [Companilactobacillus alimentarius]MDT6952420.1 TetR/AcrR family transcriptional regulator [Companilactobacillus alimentarius]
MMVGIRNNRRAKYTKKIIKETVLSLLQTKTIDIITVTEICKEADVNRTTFYRYYNDVYMCVDQIEKDFLDKLEVPEGSSLIDGLTIVLTAFYENPQLSNLVFVEGKTELLDKMLSYRPHPFKKTTLDAYQDTYIMLGFQGILKRWVKGGMKEAPDKLTKIIVQILFADNLQDKRKQFENGRIQ